MREEGREEGRDGGRRVVREGGREGYSKGGRIVRVLRDGISGCIMVVRLYVP